MMGSTSSFDRNPWALINDPAVMKAIVGGRHSSKPAGFQQPQNPESWFDRVSGNGNARRDAAYPNVVNSIHEEQTQHTKLRMEHRVMWFRRQVEFLLCEVGLGEQRHVSLESWRSMGVDEVTNRPHDSTHGCVRMHRLKSVMAPQEVERMFDHQNPGDSPNAGGFECNNHRSRRGDFLNSSHLIAVSSN